MFEQKTVKAFSIVAIVLSSLGLLLSVFGTLVVQGGSATFAFVLGIFSWAFLLWASIIGFQLCAPFYKLEADEYEKIGIRIYLVIAAFALFFFVGLVIGLALSVILLGTLWGLKRGYDEWDWDNSSPVIENTSSNDVTVTNPVNPS